MRARTLPAFLLLLLLLPSPVAPAQAADDAGSTAAAPVAAHGPDADGAWALLYDVTRAAAGPARLALAVSRTDAAGEVASATRDLGARDLAAGTQRLNLSFLPAEGPGDYAVRLVVEGVAGEPLRFVVDAGGDGASARVTFDVPDEPTSVALTSDSVNADGKAKSPGETLLTRARLQDANGVGDVERVVWRVTRADAPVAEGPVLVDAPANATEAALESGFGASPLAAGEYRLALVAQRDGADLAGASRTFVIRDVAPVLLDAPALAAVPDVDLRLAAPVVVGDRNGLDPALAIEARAYRGSARAEGLGVVPGFGTGGGANATLASVHPLPNEDGHARGRLDLRVLVRNGTAPGAYRVSLYANGTLLGSLPLDVRAPPTLGDVRVSQEGRALVLEIAGAGEGRARAVVTDASGASSSAGAAFANGSALRVPLPSDAARVSWRVELAAREGGATLAAAHGSWTRATVELRVEAPRSTARLPASWTLVAAGRDVGAANATVEVLRWDAAPATEVAATLARGRVRLDAPADVTPGRYEVRVRLAWADGAVAEASWHVEAGPWLRLALGQPAAAGREARLPLANEGGVPLGRLVVEVDGEAASVALALPDGALREGTRRGGRWIVDAAGLPPGAMGELRVRLPEGPLASGPRALDLRVLAHPGGS